MEIFLPATLMLYVVVAGGPEERYVDKWGVKIIRHVYIPESPKASGWKLIDDVNTAEVTSATLLTVTRSVGRVSSPPLFSHITSAITGVSIESGRDTVQMKVKFRPAVTGRFPTLATKMLSGCGTVKMKYKIFFLLKLIIKCYNDKRNRMFIIR